MEQTLPAVPETKTVYPYDFLYAMRGQLEDDGSITLTQEVTNREPDKELPISMGLHPYFKLPAGKKREVKFDFPGGEEVEAGVERWANGQAVSIANPCAEDPNRDIRVVIPEVGTLVMKFSPEYKRIWVWSLPDKGFVCIEPIMREAGGLVNDPELVQPGKTYVAKIQLRLE